MAKPATKKDPAVPIAIKCTPATVDAVLKSLFNEKKTIAQTAEQHNVSQQQVRAIKRDYGDEYIKRFNPVAKTKTALNPKDMEEYWNAQK